VEPAIERFRRRMRKRRAFLLSTVSILKGEEGKVEVWTVFVVVLVKKWEIVGPVRMWRRGRRG